MQERFEQRILEGVQAPAATCQKRTHSPVDRTQRVGKLLGRHSRAASCGGGVLQFSECPTHRASRDGASKERQRSVS